MKNANFSNISICQGIIDFIGRIYLRAHRLRYTSIDKVELEILQYKF